MVNKLCLFCFFGHHQIYFENQCFKLIVGEIISQNRISYSCPSIWWYYLGRITKNSIVYLQNLTISWRQKRNKPLSIFCLIPQKSKALSTYYSQLYVIKGTAAATVAIQIISTFLNDKSKESQNLIIHVTFGQIEILNYCPITIRQTTTSLQSVRLCRIFE